MAKTRDFASYIRKQLQSDPDLASAVANESFNANVAIQIHDARTASGLTQKELADRIGSHQSVIARLEDADYDGHSLSMLRRLAEALDCTLAVELFPKQSTATSKPLAQELTFSVETYPLTAGWPTSDFDTTEATSASAI
ncbi:MAG: helix-turn-helix transcriptional regulator [Planctomycetota bacterium]